MGNFGPLRNFDHFRSFLTSENSRNDNSLIFQLLQMPQGSGKPETIMVLSIKDTCTTCELHTLRLILSWKLEILK